MGVVYSLTGFMNYGETVIILIAELANVCDHSGQGSRVSLVTTLRTKLSLTFTSDFVNAGNFPHKLPPNH